MFVAVQQVEHDPTNFSDNNLRLREHFDLDDVYDVKQMPEVYEYLDSCQQREI